MTVDMSDLIATLALIEAEDRLTALDMARFPQTGVLRWLFGLQAGFYFGNDRRDDRRAAMIDLAEHYYDRTDGRCNFMDLNDRAFRLSERQDIRERLTEGSTAEAYRDTRQDFGLVIEHMNKSVMQAMDPRHDQFSALLPGAISGAGLLTYSARLSTLRDDPDGQVRAFVEACERLQVFYAVAGFSIIPRTMSSRTQGDLYPVLRRFPGILHEDGVGFSLEIEARTDVIHDVNWLTAIDDAMLSRLGGLERVRGSLSGAVELHSYAGGIVFQAGPAPRIGDVEGCGIPESYQEVNDLLRSLRFTEWGMPYLWTPDGVDRMDATEEWVRRFD